MTHKIREERSQCSICGFEAVIPNRLRAHILDVHNEFQVGCLNRFGIGSRFKTAIFWVSGLILS